MFHYGEITPITPYLGFLQSNIQDMLQDGDTLTVADVMEVAGPDYDPRHIRRAFKSLHRRGKVCLTVKAGCLAVKVKSAPRSPAQGPVADALDASKLQMLYHCHILGAN